MNTKKHSKIKNTGILFELLVRQVASDTLSSDKSEAIRIIKEYFSNKTQLGKELQLYQTIIKEKVNYVEKSIILLKKLKSITIYRNLQRLE